MSDNLIASTGEIRIGCDEDRARRILVHGGKRRVDLSFVGCPRQLELQAKRASGRLCVVEVQIGIRVGRVHQDGNGCSTRYQIVQQRQPLCRKHIGEKRDTGDIGGRVIDAPHKAELDVTLGRGQGTYPPRDSGASLIENAASFVGVVPSTRLQRSSGSQPDGQWPALVSRLIFCNAEHSFGVEWRTQKRTSVHHLGTTAPWAPARLGTRRRRRARSRDEFLADTVT